MIEVFNLETAHLYGDALPTLLKMRHREFVERLNYNVPTYNRMEYDQYDTPAAVYFVWRDDDGNIRAGTRISPTNRPYMIRDLWPQTVEFSELPSNQRVWEATRLFIDKELDKAARHVAHGQILCAYLEFALRYNVAQYIGTAPPGLWKYTFLKCGWPVEFVGNATDIGYSEKIITGMMPVSDEILQCVREQMGVTNSVLSPAFLPMEKAA
jgi:N-acyl-L-homoserine lactone synthetase